MAIPIAVPITAGVVALGAVGLRLRALALAKKPPAPPAASNLPKATPPPTPAPKSAVVVPPSDPLSVEFVESLPKLVSNPDGSPRVEGTPFIFNSNADAASAVEEANRRGVSVAQVLLERSGQLSKSNTSSDGIAAVGQRAIVTTNDPPPSGDLIIRLAPSASAPQIGGAEKNGTVTVLDSSDATFAKIQWGGGSRLPAATGFARKAFLKLI